MNFISSVFKKNNTPTSPVEKKEVKSQLAPTVPYYYTYYTNLERTAAQLNTNRNASLLVKRESISTINSFKLTDFAIHTRMTDVSTVTVFTQKYTNGYATPVEALYKLPLPPFAAVSGFVVTYNDKVLKGKIKEKEAAFNKYSDAISSGNQAFLAEKSKDGFFEISIGNLPPSKEVEISVTIISEVGVHLDDLHFCLHRYMFPSYAFNLSLELEAEITSPIESVQVDHYSNAVTNINNNKATIKLTQNSQKITNNIIVAIKPTSSEKPTYFLERDEKNDSTALAINYFPKFNISPDEVEQHSEFIFLLDCSGSMSGSAINKAKRALEILMRSLTENSMFNIYCFGSSYNSLFTTSKPYDDENLETASQYISKIDANLGGTELLPPIRAILQTPYNPKYPRQVFILTDGEVSQRDELIDFVGKESNTTRMFTLGIGGGVDRELVTGLSRSCKGYYEFIEENSQMEAQVMKLMSIAMEPTISNIRVNWGDLDVTQAPKTIRPIFNGERMMIFGRLNAPFTPESGKEYKVVVTCDGPRGKELTYDLKVDFEYGTKGDGVNSLAAFTIIRDLEEEERKTGNKNLNKDRIVELGKKYQLVSNHTSFVVVADSEDQVTEETMTKVNVMDTPIPPQIPPPQQQNLYQYQTQPTLQPNMLYRASSPRSSTSTSYPAPMAPPLTSVYSSISAPPPPPPAGGAPPPPPSVSTGYCPPPPPAPGGYPQSSFGAVAPMAYSSQTSYAPTMEKNMLCDLDELSSQCDTLNLVESEKCMKKSKQSFSFSSAPSPKPASPVSAAPRSLAKADLAPKKPVSSNDPLMDLIKSQKANGSWVEASINLTIPASPSELSELRDAWTTLCVIAKITKQFADKASQWELVVQKATKYVKSQLSKANIAAEFDSLLSKAQAAI